MVPGQRMKCRLTCRHGHPDAVALQGTVRLLFQPAEEGGAGGDVMVKEGRIMTLLRLCAGNSGSCFIATQQPEERVPPFARLQEP